MRTIAQKYIEEGEKNKAIVIAKTMLAEGDSVEKIMRIIGLSKKEIEQLV